MRQLEPGIVVNTCNTNIERLRKEDLKFKDSLDYIVRFG